MSTTTSTMTIPSLMAVADEDELEAPEMEEPLTRLPLEEGWACDGGDPDLWLYRDRTVALLKRYARLSVEVGRLPSVLGREFFRGHVTGYLVGTFEDVVIFVHDVERCLATLDDFSQKLIGKCVLMDYSRPEVARMLHIGLRTVERELSDALDRLSQLFLQGGILREKTACVRTVQKSCQEGKNDQFPVSDCRDGKNKS